MTDRFRRSFILSIITGILFVLTLIIALYGPKDYMPQYVLSMKVSALLYFLSVFYAEYVYFRYRNKD